MLYQNTYYTNLAQEFNVCGKWNVAISDRQLYEQRERAPYTLNNITNWVAFNYLQQYNITMTEQEPKPLYTNHHLLYV